ncbi:MAG: hypothetical protein MPK09_07520 [Gammaproteobacteria bacterium]|nr:hypothetical protein [Gammaproteobacteria bacterium]
MTATKRQHGQFYTVTNPFSHRAFRHWARRAGLPHSPILEPFAGCNSLIAHLQKMGLCREYAAFDVAPAARGVEKRDTLRHFPRGYDVCITNPPWLAKNSATGRGLAFPDTAYDDLYKFSVARCLGRCGYLAALVPESFIRSGLFHDRLHSFISLTKPIFADTTHPVGLALFLPEATPHITVYSGGKKVGRLADIEKCRPHVNGKRKVIFNVPDGDLGLIAVDDTHGPSIRFCHPRELEKYAVGSTSRYITRLTVLGEKVRVPALNDALHEFREATCDVLMTPYRGLRKDGKYRRRLDWDLARGLVCVA